MRTHTHAHTHTNSHKNHCHSEKLILYESVIYFKMEKIDIHCFSITLVNPNVGFSGGSDGKESACNVGDLDLNPGSGWSPQEGNSNPLSLVAQLVKNPPAMQETWAWNLGWEGLEKGMATHSSILDCRILWTEESGGYGPWCCKALHMTEWLHFHFHFQS